MSSTSTSIKFEFYGPPKAQKRHRSTAMKGGGIRNYDPSDRDKMSFIEAIQDKKPERPLTGPLAIKLEFFNQRPKAHYGSRMGEPYLKPDAPNLWFTKGRNDWDNLGKLVCDAMNGIFYEDDGQICVAMVVKRYSESPRTVVTIKPVDPNDRRWIDMRD